MKIFSITRSFDKKQWSGFITYIQLYHYPESEVFRIAKWLDSKSIWKKRKVVESSTELFSKFPIEISFQIFSNGLTRLGSIAEEYIGWMVWKESSDLKRSCKLKGLAQKGLSDEYLKIQNEVLQEPDNKVISLWDEHYKMLTYFNDYYFGISHSLDNHTYEFNQLVSSFRKSTNTIAQFLMVEIKNRENLLSEPWDHHLEFFNFLNSSDTDLSLITHKLLILSQNDDEIAYRELTRILQSELLNNYTKLIQYCIVTYCFSYLNKIIKKGAVQRGQELLDLYEFSLKKEIYTPNDNMSLTKFLNIIGVGAKMAKYEWTRKIVDNWAHKVDKYDAKLIAKFGHATIDFQQKKFSNVVQTLSQIKTLNFEYKFKSRWLLLKAQYELNTNFRDITKIQIDNYRRLITSNEVRLKKSDFEGLKSSIKILNMILSKKKKEHVLKKYNGSKYLFDRKWILQKLKNLMS